MIEVLAASPTLEARTMVLASAEEANRCILQKDLVKHFPDLILIVDDIDTRRGQDLIGLFNATVELQPGSEARLLLITPTTEAQPYRGTTMLSLEPLATAAAGRLAGKELHDNERDVAQVVGMAGGYPWFTVLLAREIAERGEAPATMDRAVDFVLASRREEREGRDIYVERASAILSVMMEVPREDALGDGCHDFVRTFDFPTYAALETAVQQCVTRGIVRQNSITGSRYVTPLLLEREIMKRFLGPNPPPSRPDGLRRLGDPYFDRVARLALRWKLDASALARAELLELDKVDSLDGLTSVLGSSTSRWVLLARHEPNRTASLIARFVEGTSLEDLHARKEIRRALVIALAETSARRGCFVDSEHALWRLACAENEDLGNNASGIWTTLFQLNLPGHYEHPRELLSHLVSRLSQDLTGLAVQGAEMFLHPPPSRSGTKPLDGPRPKWSLEDLASYRLELFRVLLNGALPARERAEVVAANTLRELVGGGIIETLDLVEKCELTPLGKRTFADELAAILEYDAAPDSPVPISLRGEPLPSEVVDRVTAVLAKLRQGSFGERLQRVVGSWGPASLRDDKSELQNLAMEACSRPSELVSEIEWLCSSDAQQARSFAEELGKVDKAQQFLEPLLGPGRTDLGVFVLAFYIHGLASKSPTLAWDILTRARGAGCHDAAAVATALHMPDEQLASAVVSELHLLKSTTLHELGRLPWWLVGLQVEYVANLAGAFIARQPPEAAAALDLLNNRIDPRFHKDTNEARIALWPVVLEVAEIYTIGPPTIHFDYVWGRLLTSFVTQQTAQRLAELALQALARTRASYSTAWDLLAACNRASSEGSWAALSNALARDNEETGHMLIAARFSRNAFSWPSEDVLEWVGGDERRARYVLPWFHIGSSLPDAVVGLLERFGAHSSVARELSALFSSTKQAVRSLAKHDEHKRNIAQSWLKHDSGAVRDFASNLVHELEAAQAYHAAIEEDEHRRWGT